MSDGKNNINSSEIENNFILEYDSTIYFNQNSSEDRNSLKLKNANQYIKKINVKKKPKITNDKLNKFFYRINQIKKEVPVNIEKDRFKMFQPPSINSYKEKNKVSNIKNKSRNLGQSLNFFSTNINNKEKTNKIIQYHKSFNNNSSLDKKENKKDLFYFKHSYNSKYLNKTKSKNVQNKVNANQISRNLDYTNNDSITNYNTFNAYNKNISLNMSNNKDFLSFLNNSLLKNSICNFTKDVRNNSSELSEIQLNKSLHIKYIENCNKCIMDNIKEKINYNLIQIAKTRYENMNKIKKLKSNKLKYSNKFNLNNKILPYNNDDTDKFTSPKNQKPKKSISICYNKSKINYLNSFSPKHIDIKSRTDFKKNSSIYSNHNKYKSDDLFFNYFKLDKNNINLHSFYSPRNENKSMTDKSSESKSLNLSNNHLNIFKAYNKLNAEKNKFNLSSPDNYRNVNDDVRSTLSINIFKNYNSNKDSMPRKNNQKNGIKKNQYKEHVKKSVKIQKGIYKEINISNISTNLNKLNDENSSLLKSDITFNNSNSLRTRNKAPLTGNKTSSEITNPKNKSKNENKKIIFETNKIKKDFNDKPKGKINKSDNQITGLRSYKKEKRYPNMVNKANIQEERNRKKQNMSVEINLNKKFFYSFNKATPTSDILNENCKTLKQTNSFKEKINPGIFNINKETTIRSINSISKKEIDDPKNNKSYFIDKSIFIETSKYNLLNNNIYNNNIFMGMCDSMDSSNDLSEYSKYIVSNYSLYLSNSIRLYKMLNKNDISSEIIIKLLNECYHKLISEVKDISQSQNKVNDLKYLNCSNVIISTILNKIITANVGGSMCLLGKMDKKGSFYYKELIKKEKNVEGIESDLDICEYELGLDDKFIIFANWTIWKYFSYEECVNLVKDFYILDDIYGATKCIYYEAIQRGFKESDEDFDLDDKNDFILIIIFFD